MRRTGDTVRLSIIKNGAHIYGLDHLLSQPSTQDERKHILEYRSPEQVPRNGKCLCSFWIFFYRGSTDNFDGYSDFFEAQNLLKEGLKLW